MEENRPVRRKKKKKKNGFKKFLAIYSGIFGAVIIITWIALYSFIKDYEQGQPDHAMNTLVSEFNGDKLNELLGKEELNTTEFETADQVVSYLQSKVNNEELKYKKYLKEYTDEAPVYELLAGDTPIAKVSLVSDGKNGHRFTVWKIGNIDVAAYLNESAENVYTIAVPKGSTVKVNGKEVSEKYVTEKEAAFAPCLNVGNYITAPTRTVYSINGLLFKPEIEVSLDGKDLEVTVEDKSTDYVAQYPTDDKLLEENADDITLLAKDYGLYLINKMDLATLKQTMIGKAAEYVSDIPALWAFHEGGTAEFDDVKLSNCIRYSDDCFSVDIEYTLKVTWTDGTAEKDYDTCLTYVYVLRDGKWYLADFTTRGGSETEE